MSSFYTVQELNMASPLERDVHKLKREAAARKSEREFFETTGDKWGY